MQVNPKALLKYIPDTDLREATKEILSWHEKGVRAGEALDRLAQMLVDDCGISADDGLLQMAEALVLAEAAQRFAEQ